MFNTSELEKNLSSRSINGAFVTLLSRLVGFAVKLASMMVLARMLTPGDFGLVAMALVVTGFAELFSDAGLSMSVVQRKELDHSQVTNLFWIMLAISLVLCGIVAGTAPLVSWVYGDERLTTLTASLGLLFLVTGPSLLHVALLKRQMQLGSLGLIEVLSQLVGLVAAITSAAAGIGYWALVVRLFAIEAARLICAWTICRWRPGLPRRDVDVKPMLTFGGNLTGAYLLSYFTSRIDAFLLGVLWGPASLGIYSRAMNLLNLPRAFLIEPLQSVAVPALSRLNEAPERFASSYRKALMLMLGGTMPVMTFTMVAADPIVKLVLGDQWGAAVPVLQVLCIAGICQSLDGASGWVNIATGHTHRRLQWRLMSSPVIVLAIVIGVQWGALGAAAAFSISALILRVPELLFCLRGTPVAIGDVMSAAWRPMLACLVIGSGCWLLNGSMSETSAVRHLAVLALAFFGSYLVVLVVACGGIRGFAQKFSVESIRHSLIRRRQVAC